MATQLALRLPDPLVEDIDRLVVSGQFRNRTEVVRKALETLVEVMRNRELDAAIVAGYTRIPDAPVEAWVEAATRAMITDEPW